jgi:hypothetical protein
VHLAVTRSQTQETDRKGRPTGVVFHLSYQLRVSPEERATIERYGLQDVFVVGEPANSNSTGHTIARLLAGDTYSRSSADSVLHWEQLVLKGALNAAGRVSQVAAFDGREMLIELDSRGQSEST